MLQACSGRGYVGWPGSWLDLAESELGILSSQCLEERTSSPGDPANGLLLITGSFV